MQDDIDYDDYIDSTPLEARFDYRTIEIAITRAMPKHHAYGMKFKEYAKYRSDAPENAETEKQRQLTFYLPTLHASYCTVLASIYSIPVYSFIVTAIELGLIHFQVDYREDYEALKDTRKKTMLMVSSEESRNRYSQLDKQVMSLGSGAGFRDKGSTKMAPYVFRWVHNAVGEISKNINMSKSDLCYFAVMNALANCTEPDVMTPFVREEFSKVCSEFSFEIRQCSKRMVDIYAECQKYNFK